MRHQGLEPSGLDPCLLLGKDLFAIIHADNVLFYDHSEEAIDDIIAYHTSRTMASGSGKFSTSVSTPVKQATLLRDIEGEHVMECCKHVSIVEMLHYLKHICPDCTFAIHQCGRYTFEQKHSHKVAAKHIFDHHFKGTMGKIRTSQSTAIPTPTSLGSGVMIIEEGSHCIRSCNGYVITFDGYIAVWVSELQTEIALLTMEVAYMALSSACRDLFYIMDLVKEIWKHFVLPARQGTFSCLYS
ncbi:hypothetical protein ACHAWF_008072 [Thalassiosira exigua]